jgi:hypothetical protein
MRLGFMLLVLAIVIAAPSIARAEDIKPCLADFIRPGTRLKVDLTTMKPPPECPRSRRIAKFNENALVLSADGKIKPTLGAVDPEGGEDSSGKAPWLIVFILRFDREVDVGRPLDLAKAQFDGGTVSALPFDKDLGGNPALHALGFVLHADESGRNAVCLMALDDGTVTLAIICRSTTYTTENDRIGMLDRMSQDDVGAIRF